MIVTAWKNGRFEELNTTYGLRINRIDRDYYFKKEWENVILKLESETNIVEVNIDKDSFWKNEKPCLELISKYIKEWLTKNKKNQWERYHPHKFEMKHLKNNEFKVSKGI